MVSVIIPTYNRAGTIKRSIESVLNQSYQDFEIIVVDDGSTDNTNQVVMEFADSRIRYLKNDRRMGANGSRNVGIQNAIGAYIAFQDSDDVWKNNKLEKQMNLFLNRKDLDVVYSRYLRHWLNGEKELVPGREYTSQMLQDELAGTLAKLNVIGTPTMVVKRKCFDECGAFDLNVRRFQDWELNIGFVRRYKYGFVDEDLVDAYVLTDSITNHAENLLESIAYIVKKHQAFFEAQETIDMHLISLVTLALSEKGMKKLQFLLGEELFFRGIYEKEKKQKNMRTNYHLLKEWVYRAGKNDYFNSFLAKYADDSIIIYGYGDMGRLFLNALTDVSGRKIKLIIDKNIPSETKYRTLSADLLNAGVFDGADCIVITAVAHEEEIRERLEKITVVPIISIRDLIGESK